MEYCVNNLWGSVCDDEWGTPDATVVCRQLGYSDQGLYSFNLSQTHTLWATTMCAIFRVGFNFIRSHGEI